MKYSRFEELPVWNASIELALRIYKVTQDPSFLRQRSLRDQLERAAVSISNNIAEGFERGTTQEQLTFIYIARGSAGEVRSMLNLIERLPSFSHLKFEISNLKSAAEEIPRRYAPGQTFCKILRSRSSPPQFQSPGNRQKETRTRRNDQRAEAGPNGILGMKTARVDQ